MPSILCYIFVSSVILRQYFQIIIKQLKLQKITNYSGYKEGAQKNWLKSRAARKGCLWLTVP